MELAAQLSHRHLDLNFVWRSRTENTEADDLTNQRFGAYDPALRLDTAEVPAKFLCMRELEEATREWWRELAAQRAAKRRKACLLIGSGLPVLHIRFEVHFKCSCTCLTEKFLTYVYIKPLDLSQITYGWRSEVCHFMYIYVYIC